MRRVKNYMWPKPDEANQNQINRDDIIKYSWDQQDQNPGNQGDEGLDRDDVDGHLSGFLLAAMEKKRAACTVRFAAL